MNEEKRSAAPQRARAPGVLLAVALLATVGMHPLAAPAATGHIDAVLARLEGLPIDEFFEASFREILLRSPESISAKGLAEHFGVRNDRLTSVDPLHLEQDYALEQGILALLRGYDRDALSCEQRLWHDTFAWCLDRWSMSLEEQLRHPLLGGVPRHSLPATIEAVLFRHPLRTSADVADYLRRIEAVPTKVAEIIDLTRLQIESGFATPRSSLEGCVRLLDDIVGNPGGNLKPSVVALVPAYRDFLARMQHVEGASAEDRKAWIHAARAGFALNYIPPLWELREYVRVLAESTMFEPQTGLFADDRAAYEAQLRAIVSTGLSPEAIHTMARRRATELAEEARAIAVREGVSSEQASVGDFLALVAASCWTSHQGLTGERLLRRFEAVDTEARQLIDTAFSGLRIPEPEIRITDEGARGSAPFYYLAPSVDGTRPGTFYIGGGSVTECAVRQLYYHELIPGHHLQVATALALDAPLFIQHWRAPGYVEGWARYCETLMEEFGGFAREESERYYGLYAELFEAIGVVMETGLHALGWTRQKACDWLAEEIGITAVPQSTALDRYASYPIDFTTYFVGKMTMLRLRDRAQQALGYAFELSEFHRAVIGSGNVPLVILDRLVSDYIADHLPSPIRDEADGSALELVTLWR